MGYGARWMKDRARERRTTDLSISWRARQAVDACETKNEGDWTESDSACGRGYWSGPLTKASLGSSVVTSSSAIAAAHDVLALANLSAQ